MRKLASIALLLALLAGCGGGGSSVPSPFAGSWAGTLALADGSGPDPNPAAVQLAVNSQGRVTGTWTDPTASGSLFGSVSRGGGLTLAVAYPGPPPVSISGSGNSTLSGSGAWQGTLPALGEENAGMSFTLEVNRQ
jgi:hypothetical protein